MRNSRRVSSILLTSGRTVTTLAARAAEIASIAVEKFASFIKFICVANTSLNRPEAVSANAWRGVIHSESTASAPLNARFAHVRPGKYRLRIYRTGYRHNDAYSAYIDMKMPQWLSTAQTEELQALTRDLPERDETVTVPASGSLEIAAPLQTNDIVLMRLERITR